MKNAGKPKIVLDAFAILVYLQAETGGDRVKEVLRKAQAGELELFLSEINAAEVYYIIGRKVGNKPAECFIDSLPTLPIAICHPSWIDILQVASFKIKYTLSLADAFCLGLAYKEKATIMTGDKEFMGIDGIVPITWLS